MAIGSAIFLQQLSTLTPFSLSLATIDLANLGGQLAVLALQAAISGLLSWRVALAVLEHKAADVADAIEKLQADAKGLDSGLALEIEKRTQCELRCIRATATKEEFARLIGQQSRFEELLIQRIDSLRNAMDSKLDDIHSRVTAQGKDVARMQGQMQRQEG